MLDSFIDNRVIVYALSLRKQISEHDYLELLSGVPESRRHKIEKFRFRIDALRSLFSYYLVKYLFQKANQTDKRGFSLTTNEFGKPYIPGSDGFQFNISHSGDWIVCAIHHLPVGIDIEEIKPVDFSVARSHFTPREYEHICNADDGNRLPCFYSIWTLKESYIKALGKGLSIPLNSFCFSQFKDGGPFLGVKSEDSHFFFEYNLCNGYKVAVCSRLAGFDEKIRFIDASDILNHESISGLWAKG
jgi:4'-phosphopantetheinyl transferase